MGNKQRETSHKKEKYIYRTKKDKINKLKLN